MNSQEANVLQWTQLWNEVFFPAYPLPVAVLTSVAVFISYFLIILPNAAFYSFLNRKLTADLQARVGPNRVGFNGFLQPFADLLKLLQKRSPLKSNWKESLWLSLSIMSLFATVAVLPFGSAFMLIDADMAVFLPFFSVLVVNFLAQLLGLGQETVNGFAGAVRLAAQNIVGSFPALLSILVAGTISGGFKWTHFLNSQGAFPWEWNVVASPFAATGFFCYLVGGMIFLSVSPFDAPFAENDIHGGVSSTLSGRRLAIYDFSRFYGLFFWVVVGVILFLGGWKLPGFLVNQLQENGQYLLWMALEVVTIILKVLLILVGMILISKVTPRLRSDQVSIFVWKMVGPLAVASYLGTIILKAIGV